MAGADLPTSDGAAEWIVYADAQTAQLDKANSRTADGLEIIGRCEARDRDAIARTRMPWWRRLF